VQTPCLLGRIREIAPDVQARIDAVSAAASMNELIQAALSLSRRLAVLIVEEVLAARALAPAQAIVPGVWGQTAQQGARWTAGELESPCSALAAAGGPMSVRL
jgi:hypothetical protein